MKIKFLLFLLVIPALAALIKPGYFPMHDDIQGMRVLQVHKCILDFQIPCRWVPDMGFGYGYPQFSFYSPLPYYLMEIPVLLGSSILASVKTGFLISLLASAFSMYFLGAYLWGKKGGFISALFYTYAPYRAVDIYVRGAMGEAWGFVFLPLILLFTLKIIDEQKTALPLALSVAGLLLTHNITSLMFLPFYVLFLFTLRRPEVASIKRIVLGGVWGFALSAFFNLPAFLEKDYVHIESILQGYFNYLAHFVGIKQLLFSTFWGYGVSTLGDLDGMSLSVGLIHWSMPLLVLALLFYLNKFDALRTTAIFVILGFGALFLIHPKSQFVWDGLGIISYIQFPWRFLAIAVFCFSIAAGALAKTVKLSLFFIALLFMILLLVNGSQFKPREYLFISDLDKFSGDSWKQQQTISILDYLPKAASHPPTAPAPAPEILDTEGQIINGQKGTNWQAWEVSLISRGKLRLQLFDFPGWEVKVDEEAVHIDNENELGLITVDVPAGTHKVEARLKDTSLRMFANILSLLALAAIPVYLKKVK